MKATNSKEILSALKALPDDQKKEVYDFIEFLKSKTKIKKKRGLVKKVYGLTKGSKLTAELFSKMKVEELTLENRP